VGVLNLGFVGKSSTWNLLRELIFLDNVGLKYIDREDECQGLDLVFVEEYIADLVHCPRTYLLNDGSIDGVVEAFVKGLGLVELNVGVDIGKSRCGIVILMGDTPIMHITLSFTRLMKLLKKLSKYSTINLIVGTSPGISNLLNDLLKSLNNSSSVRIKIIDESVVNDKKTWFRSRYPYLSADELDSLVYVYMGLASVSVGIMKVS
jgi:hypothetical protein